jgi:hypothetical protein
VDVGAELERAATIAVYEARRIALGVRGLALTTLFLLGLGLAARGYQALVEALLGQLAEANPGLAGAGVFDQLRDDPRFREQLTPALEWLGGSALVDAVFEARLPPIFLVVVGAAVLAVPPLIVLAGYDRVSDDLHSKHARFLVQRVRRETLVFGKWLGLVLGAGGPLLAAALILLGVGVAVVPELGGTAGLVCLPNVLVGLALTVAAYGAIVTFLSTLLAPPFVALLVGSMVLFALWIAQFALDPLRAVWLGRYAVELWLFDPLAIAVFVGHVLVWLAAAALVLRAKDL